MTNCAQPGCSGSIAADGYCDTCGTPAGAAPAPVSSTRAPAGTSTTGTRPSGATGRTSARLASAPIGSARTGGSARTRRLGTGSLSNRAPRLGAGLTSIPTIPIADPLSTVMVDPSVAEDKRFCSSCQSPVGRAKSGKPGRQDGFCSKCGAKYSFSPKLEVDDLVGGQYEVAGCLAHGGLGWIYLARDKNVSDRWVVLKGMLNASDPDAYEAAVAERQFLAKVQHPLVVEIYNFVLHNDEGYIVMEWVGGKSLKGILKDRMKANNGAYDALPLDHALAFVIEILPAFAYLHSLGLIYCDFKPDNMIQQGDAMKLIDLGGVRRADDLVSAIFGTVGYQAPEVAQTGPSVASDIFTIGRTLAVMAFEFRGYQSTYVDSLPDPSEVDVLAQNDSFARLLQKACAKNPDDRFQSADELRDQMLGVLREVVAGSKVATHSAASLSFDAPVVSNDVLDHRSLPTLRVDGADPAAAWLASVSVASPEEKMRVLATAPEQTVEVSLAVARAAIEAGLFAEADTTLSTILDANPWEWRAVWYQGIASLARGDAAAATSNFNTVYGEVPGELAPKLALALACEISDAGDVAERLYSTCAACDANYVAPASFAIARLRATRGDTRGALAALDQVPETSRAYVQARRIRAELLTAAGGFDELAEALDSVAAVSLDPTDAASLRLRVFETAHGRLVTGATTSRAELGGVPLDDKALRVAIEETYRHLADLEPDKQRRMELVDAANKSRPWTVV